jgi:hypothetical protein
MDFEVRSCSLRVSAYQMTTIARYERLERVMRRIVKESQNGLFREPCALSGIDRSFRRSHDPSLPLLSAYTPLAEGAPFLAYPAPLDLSLFPQFGVIRSFPSACIRSLDAQSYQSYAYKYEVWTKDLGKA